MIRSYEGVIVLYNMAGRTAIITGGAAGIGYATAERFLEEGVIVAICDVAEDKLIKAAECLRKKGTVYFETVDISDYDAVTAFVKNVHEKFGRIDILVNNAGITRDAQFYKMDIEQFKKAIDVNLMGSVNMCKACVPYMMDQHYGKIINCSSVAALSGNFGQSNYAAAKGAILSYTHTLGKELMRYGINVNAIIPGAVLTEMTMAIPEAIREMQEKKFPAKRWGSPRELANVYVFLASDEASWINCARIQVDGGYY